jgi:nitroimidazol reductase NimA-like FMN-containing flavoprotein (pyridoxamine 5'-phosphate oxidase superfamily)
MELAATARTRLRRKADRGRFDWETITTVLDDGFVCHFGFVSDGHAVVIPTAYGRVGTDLYLHGASANHALRSAASGIDVCVTVTLIDGLVLSRSAFHHSMNYRSVVVFGRAIKVEEPDEKRRALLAVVDHVVPGRSAACRAPTDNELRTTLVLRLPITEASAKVRTGPAVEEPEDLELPYWGGEIPLSVHAGTPVADGQGTGAGAGLDPPVHVSRYRRPAAVEDGKLAG